MRKGEIDEAMDEKESVEEEFSSLIEITMRLEDELNRLTLRN